MSTHSCTPDCEERGCNPPDEPDAQPDALHWTTVPDNKPTMLTERAQVPGGWLYRSRFEVRPRVCPRGATVIRDLQEFFALLFGSAYWRYQLHKDAKRRCKERE